MRLCIQTLSLEAGVNLYSHVHVHGQDRQVLLFDLISGDRNLLVEVAMFRTLM